MNRNFQSKQSSKFIKNKKKYQSYFTNRSKIFNNRLLIQIIKNYEYKNQKSNKTIKEPHH